MLYPHPALSGAPIGILLIILISEGLGLFSKTPESYRRVSYFAVVCLVILSPFTYFTGYFAASDASQSFTVSQELIAEHQSFAKLFLLSLVPLFMFSVLRPKEVKLGTLNTLFYLFLLTSAAMVVLTSSHGGDLVFEHGAGVKAGGNAVKDSTTELSR